MGKLSDILRHLDTFGKPVTLSFKRKRNFKTACGGCISVILGIVFMSSFLQQMVSELSDPSFMAHPKVTETTELFYFDSRQAMLAGKVTPLSDDISQSQIDASYRIAFMYINYKTNEQLFGIPSVRCLDLYSDIISEDSAGDYEKFWQTEENSPWICPYITQGELKEFETLVMFVVTCEVSGSKPYADGECDDSG